MNRRQYLGVLGAAALPDARSPIQLHVDLEVDPAKEKELVANFRNVFRPTIRKQPGFADVKLLKLRSTLAGQAPANCSWRLLICFQSEELRLQWVKSDDHQKAWPTLEKTLKGAKTTVLLFDQL
ncbi:MAG: antibiotic biosynthesis monooxygenase [Acidobacteria bacterium]|nr:antibiotic biosynthesis monooxygenase [Acidobacteriota bacterium]